MCPDQGAPRWKTEPSTEVCALTRNRTCNLWVTGQRSKQLSLTGQGSWSFMFSIDLCVSPSTTTTRHRLFQLNNESWSWVDGSSHFTLLFKSCFRYPSSFAFPYDFWNNLVQIYKKSGREFNMNCIKLVYQFGETDLFTKLGLPIHKHAVPLYLFWFSLINTL